MRRALAVIVGAGPRVMMVVIVRVVVMSVTVMMPMIMLVIVIVMMRVVVLLSLDSGIAFTASANGTHYSTSSSLIRISSPAVTCSW